MKYKFFVSKVLTLLIVMQAVLTLEDSHGLTPLENMVFVKGGCFLMGNASADAPPKERPAHKVCVDDFYIGRYEVTVGEFTEFTEGTGYKTEAEWQDGCHSWEGKTEVKKKEFNWSNANFPQTEKDPVTCISWNDTYEYLKWLNRKTGGNFRLPTEAEWEYAARSMGKNYRYSWGNGAPAENIADRRAKRELLGETDPTGYDDGYVFTSPVGSYSPNELGLYDMSGNVSEWINDWFDESYYQKGHENNPTGPQYGKCRVIRGGTWNPLVPNVETTTRLCSIPGGRGTWMGFRIVHPQLSSPR